MWPVLAVGGLAMACLTAAHLLFPSSSLNEAVSTVPLIAHGLAFPLPGGVALVVAGVVTLLVAFPRTHRGDPGRLLRMVAATCVTVSGLLLALSVTNVALPGPPRGDGTEGSTSFVLVSWNALDHFDATSAQQIFTTLEADVAVLPELENRDGRNPGVSRIQDALTKGGLNPQDYDIFDSPPTGTHIAPLTVIVRKGFASYESVAVEQATFGTVHLVAPAGAALPEIFAVHTAPPVPRWMAEWGTDLERVRDFAGDAGANAVIAGDLNATVRHGALGGIATHRDVLAAVPAAERGTWPASVPQVLRSSIDHVLVPVDVFSVGDARVVDIPGSDHAAIATTISIDG